MTVEKLLLILFTLLLLHSCTNYQEQAVEAGAAQPELNLSLRVKGATTLTTEPSDNQIKTISVFSFAKKPGEAAYTYEKSYLDLTPLVSGNNMKLALSLEGSLPRILYIIANDVSKISFLKNLQPTTTTKLMEELSFISDPLAPLPPYTMVAKAVLPTPSPAISLAVELTHTLSRLDIINRYNGFTVDSMIVRDAVSGTYLFSEPSAPTNSLQRVDISYLKRNPIYIYETSHSVLSIFGKYNGIRAVFDIDLKNIEKGTRYNVIFRSASDSDLDVSSNLIWDVKPWTKGDTIDSTIDW